MPINSKIRDYEKERKLLLYIEEAKRRGIEIPKVNKKHKFPMDSRGYFVKEDGVQFNPNEEQARFIDSTAPLAAFITGRGGGKSCSSAQKALRKIAQGKDGVVLNPTFEDLKKSTWPEFREWCPWRLVVPQQRYRGKKDWEPRAPFALTFINGSRVYFTGVREPDSMRGGNYNWLWYDEAGNDPDGLAWQIALAAVRIGEDIQAWISTTPKGRQHWVYKFFVQQDIPEDAKKAFQEICKDGQEFIEMFYSSIWDNKDNLNPVFFANILASYSVGWLRDQEVYGKFIDAGGQFGDRRWFDGNIIQSPPDIVDGRIRYWDLAATEKKVSGKKKTDPDETVGTLLSWQKDAEVYDKLGNKLKVVGRFFIEGQVFGYWKWKSIKKEIVNTAYQDGPQIKIYIEQEPGSGGINQVAALKEQIQKELGIHYKVEGHNPKENGDKLMRANTWFSEAALGVWYIVFGNWNNGFFDQLDSFDGSGKIHDDRVDSVSGARHCLAPIRLWKSIRFLHIGQKSEKEYEESNKKKKILI